MRGTIRVREGKKLQPNGKPVITYQAIVDVGLKADGKRKQKWKTFKTRKEAEKALNESINQVNTGNYIEKTKDSVSEYLNQWLDDCCKPNLSVRTYELYRYMSEKHIIPTLGKTILSDLKPKDLQHLYAEKLKAGLSPRTVQLIHVCLHKALKNAVKTSLLSRNIAEAVDSPKSQRREMHVMDETDLHLFLEYAKDTPYYALFYCSLFTGMRRSELLALQWKNIDLYRCQISVTRSMEYNANAEIGDRIKFKEPKTIKSRRLVSLTPSTCIILREHLEARKQHLKSKNPKFDPEKDFNQDELVFCHKDGSPYLPDSITHAWIKLVRKSGLKGIRLHDARHSHASLLLKQGIHPKIVQERLGHAGIAITLDLYSHVAPGLQQAAANKFDDIVFKKESTSHKA